MKYFALIWILVIILNSCSKKDERLAQLTFDGSTKHPYMFAKWSPDGKMITAVYKNNFMVLDKNGQKLKEIHDVNTAPTYLSYRWSLDGNYIAIRSREILDESYHKKESQLIIIDMKSFKIIEKSKSQRWLSIPRWATNEEGEYAYSFDESGNEIISSTYRIQRNSNKILNDENFRHKIYSYRGERKDELKLFNKEYKQELGRYNSQFSNDRKKVLYSLYGKNIMCIYDISKKTVKKYIHPYGNNLFIIKYQWSNDDKSIILLLEKDGHYDIENFDIAIFDIQIEKFNKITETPDILEYCPNLSPNNKDIIYRNIDDGNIYKLKVKGTK